MRVLVVGSGAREHAIAHALRRAESVEEVYAAPGNPGIGLVADTIPVSADDIQSLAEAAADLRIDLTVVGPELPLALGIGDLFAQRGLRLFGPNREAARLESSKVFSKEFCQRHGIPTAPAEVVTSAAEAEAAVARLGLPVVLKADGLAAGKGVIPVFDREGLDEALDVFFVRRRFGEAGDRVLVETFLEGEELSYMVISDGRRALPLATSHDYKRLLDGDRGPNTGGMGSHSPAVLPPGTAKAVMEGIVMPTIHGMAAEGRPYRGVLYVGVMLTADGPKVLEYNCRMGDPETQSILLRLESDLAETLAAAADGRLPADSLEWRREVAVCVVLASEGYPGSARKGVPIEGIDEALALPGVTVYQAGTAVEDGRLVTAGGRVLSVCGRGNGLAEAMAVAYGGVERIQFEGMQYRRDIGRDSLERLKEIRGGE